MGVQLRRYDVMRASDRTLPTVSASQNNKNRQSYQRRTSHGAMRTNEEAIHCYRNDRLKIFLGAQIMRRDTGKRLPSSPNPHVVNIQHKGSERLTSMRRAQIPQLLGMVIFVLRTRPECATAVSLLSGRTKRAPRKDYEELRHTSAYLYQTIDKELVNSTLFTEKSQQSLVRLHA